jgi:hypothetical protein
MITDSPTSLDRSVVGSADLPVAPDAPQRVPTGALLKSNNSVLNPSNAAPFKVGVELGDAAFIVAAVFQVNV